MREIFIGSEAVADGIVTRHELARWYRPFYPNVHALKGRELSLADRATGAWPVVEASRDRHRGRGISAARR